MDNRSLKHKFVWNLTDFKNLKPNQYDHVLGKNYFFNFKIKKLHFNYHDKKFRFIKF